MIFMISYSYIGVYAEKCNLHTWNKKGNEVRELGFDVDLEEGIFHISWYKDSELERDVFSFEYRRYGYRGMRFVT